MSIAKVRTAGWVVFVILLICCFPICWIGLTMKERYTTCPHCMTRVGG